MPGSNYPHRGQGDREYNAHLAARRAEASNKVPLMDPSLVRTFLQLSTTHIATPTTPPTLSRMRVQAHARRRHVSLSRLLKLWLLAFLVKLRAVLSPRRRRPRHARQPRRTTAAARQRPRSPVRLRRRPWRTSVGPTTRTRSLSGNTGSPKSSSSPTTSRTGANT